jgi:hypothetical protein
MNSREKAENVAAVEWSLNFVEDHTTEVTLGKQHHTFSFDKVFDPDSLQVYCV